MKKITILFLFFSFLSKANTYYVALNGSDSYNGSSLSLPFLTITKATNLAVAGDQIYVRGGNYAYKSTITLSKSGSSSAPIRLEGYNNERVKIDFSGASSRGITLSGNYWYIRGLDITKAGSNGMLISGAYNTVEFCSFYENWNSGLQLSNGAHDNRVINCDSYWNIDVNYADADGFACKMAVGNYNYFYGCRSWINVDDGWDGYLRGTDDVYTTVENCWTWGNGYLKNGTDKGYHANGQGFKMGGSDSPSTLKHNFTLRNCLAFDNKANGFDQNNNMGTMLIENCTAFRNNKVIDYTSEGHGISKGANFNIYKALATGKTCTIRNCVSIAGPVNMTDWVVQSTNSWHNVFTVTEADFMSLDTTGVSGPRQADGSLPRINLCRLQPTSDLIDSGTKIGLDYLGAAPDLGAFEYNSNLTALPKSGRLNQSVAFFAGDNLIIRRNKASDCLLKIIDINGHVVLKTKIYNEAVDINCNRLAKGIYVLELSGKEEHSGIKIIR